LRLAEQYVDDVGCFSIFLLNCLKLKQGEAIFLSANIPHAYLFGDGVECMACSDNVVRAGLTPKFKDVNVLCDMLDYRMRSSEDNKLVSVRTSLSSNQDYLIEFRPSVDEFSVQQIKIEQKHLSEGQKSFLIPKSDTGSILIVIEMNSSASYFSFNDKKLNANLGLVYYIYALTDVYFNLESDSDNNQNSTVLLAFRAYTDIKSN
jgi:mannose-6-phosphate isomerase